MSNFNSTYDITSGFVKFTLCAVEAECKTSFLVIGCNRYRPAAGLKVILVHLEYTLNTKGKESKHYILKTLFGDHWKVLF